MANTELTNTFSDIADAIRAKGVSGTMTPLEMAGKVEDVQAAQVRYGITAQDYIGDTNQSGELVWSDCAFSSDQITSIAANVL